MINSNAPLGRDRSSAALAAIGWADGKIGRGEALNAKKIVRTRSRRGAPSLAE